MQNYEDFLHVILLVAMYQITSNNVGIYVRKHIVSHLKRIQVSQYPLWKP